MQKSAFSAVKIYPYAGERAVDMGFFSNMYTKEGPGVRKDQPPKKGDSALFEILMRDYGHLLKVNFLFLFAACPPMVTVVLFGLLFHQYLGMLLIAAVLYLLCSVLVGPAMTCLHGITIKTVRDEPRYSGMNSKKMLEGQLEAERACGRPVLHAAGNGVYRGLVLYVYAVGDERAAGGIRGVQPAAAHDLLAVHDPADAVSRSLWAVCSRTACSLCSATPNARPAGLITLVIVIGVVLFVPVPIMLLLLFLGMPALVAVIGGYVGSARDGTGVPHL